MPCPDWELNGQCVLKRGLTHYVQLTSVFSLPFYPPFLPQSSKYDSNANNAGTEIDSLIEAAKARAQRREIAKVEREAIEDESLLRAGKRTETYAALQAPWHTDFNDNDDMNLVNGGVKKLSSKVTELKQKTTNQADFPEYSTQELKVNNKYCNYRN